jgi:hypothetical protein
LEYFKKSFNKKSNEQKNIPEILKDESVIIEHFQKQGNPSHFNSNFKKEIENQLKTMEEDMVYKAESDSTITYKEIKKAIFDLRKGKSAGPDRILNEVIKYTNPVMINSYMKIFNAILKTGIYPKSWKESFTIPIYKSGDKNDPNNYRGVSLVNCLPKIFNTILNNRLIKIIEDQLSNSQFGFRENHRTADSIFVFKSFINKYIHKKKMKMHACFVDLRKAFDSVWREALLYKLCKMGVGLHLFKLLKEQHLNTTSSLKHKDQHSVFFNISRGVKQGDSKSLHCTMYLLMI